MPFQQKSSSSIKRRGGSSTNKSAKPESGQVSNKNDRHNTEQPCCEILAHFALQVLPAVQASSEFNHLQNANSSDKSYNKTNINSSSSNGGSSNETFPILLREYLLEQHAQRQKILSETTTAISANAASLSTNNSGIKKKRKKKKKKKQNSSSMRKAVEEEHTVPGEDDEEVPSSLSAGADEEALSSEPYYTQNPELSAIETCDSAAEEPTSSAHPSIEMLMGASAEPCGENNGDNRHQVLQQKIERQRRIQALLDLFLDRYIASSQAAKTTNTAAVGTSDSSSESKPPGCSSNGNKNISPAISAADAPVDLQPLHSYIATLSDDCEERSDPAARNNNPALLPIACVRAAVEQIQCTACRRDVERCLLVPSRYAEPPLRLLGVTVPTVYDTYQQQHDLEVETTQYQLLMEEGTAPPENAEYWTWNRVFSTNDQLQQPELEGWKLQRPLAMMTATNESWSMADLDVLLQQYLILQGLAPDTVAGVTSWNDSNNGSLDNNKKNALDSISETAGAKYCVYETDLNNVVQPFAKSLESFYEDSRAAQNDLSGNTVNWKSFSVMRKADEACDVIMHDMLRICFDLTRSVQLVLTEHSGGDHDDVLAETHWATEQCTELWRIYLGAAHEIFRLMSEYESKLFALIKDNNSNGSDKLPEFFISAKARALYRTLVDRKIRVCHGLTDKVDVRLRHPTNIGGWTSQLDTNKDTTFLRRVLLEEAYYKFVAGESKQRRPRQQQRPLDVACEDVLTTIRECLSTVHGPTASKLLEEHHNRDEKLMRLVRNVEKLLEDRIRNSRGCGDNGDASSTVWKHMLQQVRNLNSTSRPASDFASCDDKLDYLKLRRETLGPALIPVMKDWVQYRIFDRLDDDIDGTRTALPIMPHAVRRRMLTDYFTCHGGNERSRAACLLVGLFFRRLSDGFKGFQAHMAAQELLTTVNSDDANMQSKSSKKSKKKKGKKSVVAVSEGNDQPLESTIVTPERQTLENGDNDGDGENAIAVIALVGESESSGETTTMTAAVFPTNGNAKVNIPASEVPRSTTSEDTSASRTQLLDACIQCGVYDKSDFQTAETFLVGRLTSLLEVGEEDAIVRI